MLMILRFSSRSVRQWLMLPALVVLIALVACATERTPDGRFGTQCRSPPGKEIGLCLVSLYRLIARPGVKGAGGN